jgi:hypothetical protein
MKISTFIDRLNVTVYLNITHCANEHVKHSGNSENGTHIFFVMTTQTLQTRMAEWVLISVYLHKIAESIIFFTATTVVSQ